MIAKLCAWYLKTRITGSFIGFPVNTEYKNMYVGGWIFGKDWLLLIPPIELPKGDL